MKVSCKTIAAMISRNNKHLIFDIADVVEWVGEAVVNIGQFDAFRRYPPFEGEYQTITNHRLLLPCHMYRLLGVYRNNVEVSATEFVRNGAYLDFHRWDRENIQFDYIGVDVDEEGYPYVDKSQLQACYWYCLKMLYLEDFINGKIDGNRFNYIDEQYAKYVAKAKGSFMNITRNEMDEIGMIFHQMVPSLRMPKGIT